MSSSPSSVNDRRGSKDSTSVNRSQSITLATLKSTVVSHILGSGKSIGSGSEAKAPTFWIRKESAHAWLSCYAQGDESNVDDVSTSRIPKNFASGRRIEPPPLNSKEIYRLKASWNSALETHGSIKEAGLVTILCLFKQRPDLLHFFEQITGHSLIGASTDQLRANISVQTQAARLFKAIDRMICFIDDSEQIDRLSYAAAQSYSKFDWIGFTSDKFHVLVDPLLNAVRHLLGPRFNSELDSIYKRAFNYVLSEVENAFAMPPPANATNSSPPPLITVHTVRTHPANLEAYGYASTSTASEPEEVLKTTPILNHPCKVLGKNHPTKTAAFASAGALFHSRSDQHFSTTNFRAGGAGSTRLVKMLDAVESDLSHNAEMGVVSPNSEEDEGLVFRQCTGDCPL